jgi:hypothetical protein
MKINKTFPGNTSFFGLLMVIITLGACNTVEIPPTLVPAKTLPPTWTLENTSEASLIPQSTSTLASTATLEPNNNWWVLTLDHPRNLRVNFAAETKDGGVLAWADVRDQNQDVVGSVLLKLNKYGLPEWEKILSPGEARIHHAQELEDGTIYLSGFHKEMEFYHPFYILISEDGLILSSLVYQGLSQVTDRHYFHAAPAGSSAYLGKLSIKGELPGDHYVSDYAVLPDGNMTVMGPIHGPITSGGSTFSYLRGFWAVRVDNDDQVIWQRFFQTKPTGPFFEGSILSGGNILISQDQLDYLTILKLNPDGFPAFWRHYSQLLSVQSFSGTEDGSTIIAAGRTDLVKLDGEGNVLWSKELATEDERLWIQYALEVEGGDLILFLGSGGRGTVVSRLDIQQPFLDCPLIHFGEKDLVEHFPSSPINLSGSVRVTPSKLELEEWMTQLSFEDLAVNAVEMCRYQDSE